MRVNSAIAALRGDRTPQRRAQSAMDLACRTWREAAGAAEVVTQLQAYGEGRALADCPDLSRLFAEPGEAERLVGSLAGLLCDAMRANPIGHPPFRHGFDGSAATLLLAKSGRAQLLLQSREPGDYSYSSATFSDAERHEAVLAGEGRARLLRLAGADTGPARLDRHSMRIAGGVRLAIDISCECLLIDRVDTRLVTLRLLRLAELPAPSREYRIDTGELIHQAAGDLATSHQESMVALLGRMGRTDAAPVLAELARDAGDTSLRWQALRECLALDTATGFAALATIARAADDPLAGDAGALRAQLVEAHPQLLELEGQSEGTPCPA